jgi:hypothetical protein
LDLLAEAEECVPGAPAQVDGLDAIYLGIIEQRQQSRLRVSVEHVLDRHALGEIQATWKESGSPT